MAWVGAWACGMGRSVSTAPSPLLLCAAYRKELVHSRDRSPLPEYSELSAILRMSTHEDPTLQSASAAVSGTVELIFGPMFAGKTTELLRRVRERRGDGQLVGLVKSSIDQRYTCGHVTTHGGDELPCIQADRLMQVLKDEEFMRNQIIAVDEAQFFPDLVDFVTCAVEVHYKTVVVAGLDGDFSRWGRYREGLLFYLFVMQGAIAAGSDAQHSTAQCMGFHTCFPCAWASKPPSGYTCGMVTSCVHSHIVWHGCTQAEVWAGAGLGAVCRQRHKAAWQVPLLRQQVAVLLSSGSGFPAGARRWRGQVPAGVQEALCGHDPNACSTLLGRGCFIVDCTN